MKAQRIYREFQQASGANKHMLVQELLRHKRNTKQGWRALGLDSGISNELADHSFQTQHDFEGV
jgi:hypothetical protein